MIAIREAQRAGLLQRQHWLPNITAGFIVGIVALPLAMAFAIASGAKPESGLYTAIVAGLAVSLFGGSRIQIAGPTGAFIVILAGINATYGFDGLLLSTLMAGIILVCLGIAKFGRVIRFIPAPVIVGFTAGIAVIIWIGQWKDFFGLPAVEGEHFHEKLWHLLQVFPQLHLPTTLLALLGLLLALYSARIPGFKRVPAPLTAMVIVTAILAIFQFDGVATIASAFGGIPRSLPSLTLPVITFDRIILLLPSAFTIAMLGAIESLLSAVVADGMSGTKHDSNQELIGQGIANILSPLFGGIAATGAIARTATNFHNGATSPIAGIVHSVTLIALLLFFGPYVAYVPLAALAAILFVVAWNMSDAQHFIRMTRTAPKSDVVILLITFFLTIFTDLVMAVNIGVILAMLQFLRRMASSVDIIKLEDDHLSTELAIKQITNLPPNVAVYSIEGPLFFGAMEQFERALAHTNTTPKYVIIRLQRVPFLDATGLETLEEVMHKLEQHGTTVFLCEAGMRVLRKLVRAGIVTRTGPVRYFAELSAAIESCV